MSAYGSYQNAYRRASVNTMDQGKLIVMLYDGAIRNVNFALQHLTEDEVEKSHNCLVKAKNIVTELLSTLNMEQGGEIAKNLQSLYSYMFNQLVESNVRKDPKPAESVLKLLRELREAWVHIGKKQPPAASVPARPGAMPAPKNVRVQG